MAVKAHLDGFNQNRTFIFNTTFSCRTSQICQEQSRLTRNQLKQAQQDLTNLKSLMTNIKGETLQPLVLASHENCGQAIKNAQIGEAGN